MLRSITLVMLLASSAFAQQSECPTATPCKVSPPKRVSRTPPKYEMDKIDLEAKNRKLMLVTFLERAAAELMRGSLQKRSFIPELVKTVDAETL